jgi:hypothetical protein
LSRQSGLHPARKAFVAGQVALIDVGFSGTTLGARSKQVAEIVLWDLVFAAIFGVVFRVAWAFLKPRIGSE